MPATRLADYRAPAPAPCGTLPASKRPVHSPDRVRGPAALARTAPNRNAPQSEEAASMLALPMVHLERLVENSAKGET